MASPDEEGDGGPALGDAAEFYRHMAKTKAVRNIADELSSLSHLSAELTWTADVPLRTRKSEPPKRPAATGRLSLGENPSNVKRRVPASRARVLPPPLPARGLDSVGPPAIARHAPALTAEISMKKHGSFGVPGKPQHLAEVRTKPTSLTRRGAQPRAQGPSSGGRRLRLGGAPSSMEGYGTILQYVFETCERVERAKPATAGEARGLSDSEGHQRWELADGAKLFDVTHLPCRSARYTGSGCSPSGAAPADFPVRPGAAMPAVKGCQKQDHAVLFVLSSEPTKAPTMCLEFEVAFATTVAAKFESMTSIGNQRNERSVASAVPQAKAARGPPAPAPATPERRAAQGAAEPTPKRSVDAGVQAEETFDKVSRAVSALSLQSSPRQSSPRSAPDCAQDEDAQQFNQEYRFGIIVNFLLEEATPVSEQQPQVPTSPPPPKARLVEVFDLKRCSMAVVQPRTLDIKEPQILRHYPNDAAGFLWHHRVLLPKTAPGIWIGATPDGDIERIDLNVTAHVPLERRADFPVAQAPFVYAFDPIPRADLEAYHRRAKVMANLFNDQMVADVDSYDWVIADVSHPDFGAVVPDDEVEEGVNLRDSGLVERDGGEVFIKRIASAHRADWILQKEKTKGDVRLLGNHVDGQGKRFLDFRSGVTLMRNTPFDDWPLSGPRAVLEFLKAVREGSSDMVSYHHNWVMTSGVSNFSAAAHEHKILADIIRVGIATDQVDLSNLMMAELAVRRVVQIEMAVARNPSAPDYSGLDLVMEQPVGEHGQAVTLGFNNWLASKLKDRANVQKQARLYREEFGSRRGKGGEDELRGKGRGRGRSKGNSKAGAADSASSGA
eukprot:s1103_g3.t2